MVWLHLMKDTDEAHLRKLIDTEYGPLGEGRGTPLKRVPAEVLLPWINRNAFDRATDVLGDSSRQPAAEVLHKVQDWPAFRTFIDIAWDERWDHRNILPQTDAVMSDQAIGSVSFELAEMITSRARLSEPYDKVRTSPQEVFDYLEQRGVEGSLVDGAMAKVLIPIYGVYGIDMNSMTGVTLSDDLITQKDKARISPDGTFTATALFEELYLRGADTPTLEKLAAHFQGISDVLQFRTVAEVLDVLGALSCADASFQAASLRFYKQHKTMLYSRTLQRTHQAIEKLDALLMEIEESADELLRPVVKAARGVLNNRMEFDKTIMSAELIIAERIASGYYDTLEAEILDKN